MLNVRDTLRETRPLHGTGDAKVTTVFPPSFHLSLLYFVVLIVFFPSIFFLLFLTVFFFFYLLYLSLISSVCLHFAGCHMTQVVRGTRRVSFEKRKASRATAAESRRLENKSGGRYEIVHCNGFLLGNIGTIRIVLDVERLKGSPRLNGARAKVRVIMKTVINLSHGFWGLLPFDSTSKWYHRKPNLATLPMTLLLSGHPRTHEKS